MSVQRTRTGKYAVRWRDGGKQLSKSFDRKKDAASFDVEVRRRLQLGAFAPVEPSSLPLDDFMEKWISQGVTWRKKTRDERKQARKRWIEPLLGDVPLRMLGRDRIRQFRAEMVDEGATANTVNNVHRVLSACLSMAAEDGLIPANPALRMPKMQVAPPARRALPDKLVLDLLKKMPTPRDKAAVALLSCGLRPGEVCGLKWGDMTADVLVVRRTVQNGSEQPTKTNVGRRVPIWPNARPWLLRAPENADNDWVVPGTLGGPLNWPNWRARVWHPVAEAVGTDAVPYELRHTAASRLIRSGMDLIGAAAIMGHSVKVMSETYLHLVEPPSPE